MNANLPPGPATIRNDDVDALTARLRKLAEDKSNLQLVVRLMEHINPLPGVEDMIRSLLANIVETIGGTNIKLYYWIGTELHYADFAGCRSVLASIDDPVVAAVAQTRQFIEERGEDTDTLLTEEQVAPGAWIWAFPLVVGADLIGVIKIENLHISGASLRTVLPVFFSHAALILSNEIRNFARQQAEVVQKRLNRELRAISNCNQALLRAEDEQTLLDQVCHIICDEAGYCMAWVGYAEHDDAMTVRPHAWAGEEAGYLSLTRLTWADSQEGHRPFGIAIRSGETSYAQDFSSEPWSTSWTAEALKRGYRSGIALPLQNDKSTTFGALCIYSTQTNAFTPDEINLLEELAGDLAYGITALRLRAKQEEAKEKLQASEQLFRALVENSPDHIARYDRELHRVYVNPAIRKLFKAPFEQVLGNTPASASPLVDPASYMAAIRRVVETAVDQTHEGAYRTVDGEIRWSSWRFTPEFGADGKVATVLVISRDITERKRAEDERKAHLHFLESMDRINRILQQTGDLEWIMNDALDAVQEIFGCDRAYLLYPCDPTAATWSVPMERSRPEYPGALRLGLEVAMEMSVRSKMRTLLGSTTPLCMGPGTEYPIAPFLLEQFSVRSLMAMALHPKIEKPWEFGIHQCSHDRSWSAQEVRLFEEIGHRLSDGLSNLLITRNLRESESSLRLAASVFATSQEGIVISDPDNRIIDVNPAFTRLTGYSREEVLGQNPRLMSSGRHNGDFYAAMWRSIKTKGAWQGEIWNRRKSGETFAELLSIIAVKDDQGHLQHYVGAFSDISVLKEHEADLDRIAHYDVLTSVPNRRLLGDRLEQAIARARRLGKNLAVCYLDLDGFKPINDQFGHEGGDRLLVEIARRLQANSRADDTVARLGGDEFVMLWNDIDHESECFLALDRILAEVSSPMLLDGVPVSVSASIGVTLYPDDNVDADNLLRHADHAMYSAKQLGKNRYQLFDARLERQISSRVDFLAKVANGLNSGQFELYYQPKVDCVAGRLIGVEALIRWHDPILGLVGPKEFLPLIENDNLAFHMGRWVMEQAVRQARSWHEMNLDIPISINVFPRHLKFPTFIEDLRNVIARQWPAMPANRLIMEIVETSDLEELDPIEAVINECLGMGIGFSLDDFGTGYSSLVYLRRLSVEELKIDQSFVRDMMSDPDDQAIVAGVIALGTAFSLRVVAEGVESAEQARHLVAMGCSTVQGYGFGHPMPAHAVSEWLSQFLSQGVRI